MNITPDNPFFATGHIVLWLLIAGLFLPRIALLFACFGAYPPNPMPILFNFLGWLLVPRFLMAYYIYINIGMNNIWFLAYVITGLVGVLGEGHVVHHRVIRRIYPDGSETIEEV